MNICKRVEIDISDTRVIPDVLCHDLKDAFSLIRSFLEFHKESDIHHILITKDAESGLRLTIGYWR